MLRLSTFSRADSGGGDAGSLGGDVPVVSPESTPTPIEGSSITILTSPPSMGDSPAADASADAVSTAFAVPPSLRPSIGLPPLAPQRESPSSRTFSFPATSVLARSMSLPADLSNPGLPPPPRLSFGSGTASGRDSGASSASGSPFSSGSDEVHLRPTLLRVALAGNEEEVAHIRALELARETLEDNIEVLSVMSMGSSGASTPTFSSEETVAGSGSGGATLSAAPPLRLPSDLRTGSPSFTGTFARLSRSQSLDASALGSNFSLSSLSSPSGLKSCLKRSPSQLLFSGSAFPPTPGTPPSGSGGGAVARSRVDSVSSVSSTGEMTPLGLLATSLGASAQLSAGILPPPRAASLSVNSTQSEGSGASGAVRSLSNTGDRRQSDLTQTEGWFNAPPSPSDSSGGCPSPSSSQSESVRGERTASDATTSGGGGFGGGGGAAPPFGFFPPGVKRNVSFKDVASAAAAHFVDPATGEIKDDFNYSADGDGDDDAERPKRLPRSGSPSHMSGAATTRSEVGGRGRAAVEGFRPTSVHSRDDGPPRSCGLTLAQPRGSLTLAQPALGRGLTPVKTAVRNADDADSDSEGSFDGDDEGAADCGCAPRAQGGVGCTPIADAPGKTNSPKGFS